jgi:hypothetical protein
MGERIFVLAEICAEAPAPARGDAEGDCTCLMCTLADVFAAHLDAERPADIPRPFRVTGHRALAPAPGFTTVPHFMACRWPGAEADAVVWEMQDCSQLRNWLPPGCDLDRLDAAAAAIPRLLAIRHRLRCGDLVLAGAAGAALDSGRYPSVRFFLEYWCEIPGTER